MFHLIPLIVLGYVFSRNSSSSSSSSYVLPSIGEKFKAQLTNHENKLESINNKLSGLKVKKLSDLTKAEAERFYPIYDECANIAHAANIDFSSIFTDIDKKIKELSKDIESATEPTKSKLKGEHKTAINMSKALIKNVASSKKLRDKLNKDKEKLKSILKKPSSIY